MTIMTEITQGAKALIPPDLWYGLASSRIAANVKAPVVIGGGNEVWGLELLLHDSAAAVSGNYFNIQKLLVKASENANRCTYLQFYMADKATPIAADFKNTGDLAEIAKNVIADGTKVVLGADVPVAVNVNQVYYTRDYSAGATTDPNTIKLTDLPGGTAIALASDTTGTISVITQTLLCTIIVNAGTAGKADADNIGSGLVKPSQLLSCRGMAVETGTNNVSFYLGLNIY